LEIKLIPHESNSNIGLFRIMDMGILNAQGELMGKNSVYYFLSKAKIAQEF